MPRYPASVWLHWPQTRPSPPPPWVVAEREVGLPTHPPPPLIHWHRWFNFNEAGAVLSFDAFIIWLFYRGQAVGLLSDIIAWVILPPGAGRDGAAVCCNSNRWEIKNPDEVSGWLFLRGRRDPTPSLLHATELRLPLQDQIKSECRPKSCGRGLVHITKHRMFAARWYDFISTCKRKASNSTDRCR